MKKPKEEIFIPVVVKWEALEKREFEAINNLIKHLEEIRKVKNER